jgi:hypothetical protein
MKWCFLKQETVHTLTINYSFYIQDGSINTNNVTVVLYSISKFIKCVNLIKSLLKFLMRLLSLTGQLVTTVSSKTLTNTLYVCVYVCMYFFNNLLYAPLL